MKPIRFLPLIAAALVCMTGCDKSSPDAAQRVAELEHKANEALARQQELERQLEDQRLAAERDAIERERLQIEEARTALEIQQQENAAAEAEALRQREEELARREGRLEQAELTLQDQASNHEALAADLSERERELAGREALVAEELDNYPTGPVADYGMFYDSLSSYGSWFETPDYGYVWQPVIVRDVSWRPYTRGRWACTDYGWTWMSDEPFGWATYHYGRWALLRGHGWVWVPGSEWAPSWVSWRSGGTCIGWAPLPPETLAWRSHNWGNTVDVTFSIGSQWFSFVEYRHFSEPIHRHCLPYRNNHDYYRKCANITNIHVYNHRIISGGPRYDDIRRRGCKSLPYYRLDVDRHGRPGRDSLAMRPRVEDGRLRVSAPNIDADWNSELRPTKLRGRLQSVTVERPEPLKPEIIENFRKSRENDHSKARRVVAESGGGEAFNRSRLEKLEANRREFAALDKKKGQVRSETPKAPGKPKPPFNNAEVRERENTVRIDPEQQPGQVRNQQPDKSRSRLQKPGQPQTGAPSRENPASARSEQQKIEQANREQDQLREQARQQEEARLREQARQQQLGKNQPDNPQRGSAKSTRLGQRQPSEPSIKQQQQRQLEQQRQQQIEQARQQQQQQQKQQINQQRQQQLREQAQQQQEQQLQQARQQQEQQRQLEQQRQQQLEQARQQQQREQARQQQERQLEQQRQNQLQQARQQQEQQRQQQLEQARQQQQREQARQQQERHLEQQRQNQLQQARQQQQEQARQQQRQMEQQRQQQQQQQSRERQQSESKKNDEDRGLRRR